MSSLWSLFSPIDWISVIWQCLEDFLSTVLDLKDTSQILKLLALTLVLVAVSIHFVRFMWRHLFPTPQMEDLLHFKAAPAGDRAAVISIQGQRKYMEDTYQAIPNLQGHSNWSYYGVYDGHGGARCSVYVAHYLHKHVLAWIDAYIAHYSSNSTRLIAQLMQSLSNSNTPNTSNAATKTNNSMSSDATKDGTSTLNANNGSNVNQSIHSDSNHNNNNNTNNIGNGDLIETNRDSIVAQDLNTTIMNELPLNAMANKPNGNNTNLSQKEENGDALIRPHDADDIPQCIVRIMNEILLKSHRKADQEFLQLAHRQRWKDGSTAVSCIMVPGKDLIASLIDGVHRNGTGQNPECTVNPQSVTKNKNGSLSTPRSKSSDALSSTQNEKADKRRDIERVVGGFGASDLWMFVANTGDSRGILVSRDGRIVEMSHDHKPNSDSERSRIVSDGGRVVFFGTWRVEGILAVSRSFGDRLLKQWIIPDPEVIAHKVNGDRDLFLILATDGVWDTVSNQEAARCALESWNDPKQTALSLNQRLRAIAQKITSFAYTRGSMDNITTLVVHLPSHCAQ